MPYFCRTLQCQTTVLAISYWFNWRSLGDSNPCFRRERAKASSKLAMLWNLWLSRGDLAAPGYGGHDYRLKLGLDLVIDRSMIRA